MPVNMEPGKRRRQRQPDTDASSNEAGSQQEKAFGEQTAEDLEKELADAERKNLWEATEVIDMDTW